MSQLYMKIFDMPDQISVAQIGQLRVNMPSVQINIEWENERKGFLIHYQDQNNGKK